MIRYIIGIDPGFTGAIACLDLTSMDVIVHDIPVLKDKQGRAIVNSAELVEILVPPAGTEKQVQAVLEKVHAMPKQGVSSTFRFGQCYGSLQTALAAHRIPVHDITPPTWKKYFGLSNDKGVSRGLAIQRFPRQADQFKRIKDDGRAEAALLALYGKEKCI